VSDPDREPIDRHEALWSAGEDAVVGRESGDLVGTLTAKVRVAAQGEDADDRSWALIVLGATLRKDARAEEALEVLREAHALTDDEEIRRAAITCAMAVYCDLDEDEEARRIGLEAQKIGTDPFLLRVLGRAWKMGYRATGLIEFDEEGDRCFALAESPAALAAG
jgi:hypothetical protein